MVIADSAIRVASATDRRNRANSRLRLRMTFLHTRTAAPQPTHVPNAWPMEVEVPLPHHERQNLLAADVLFRGTSENPSAGDQPS
jgi:hypothetical protein